MILADSEILARQRRMPRDEYHHFIELGFFQRERLELIHGILVEMSPIGVAHRRAVDRLTRLLVRRLSDLALVSIQQPFLVSDHSEPEPDISVTPLGTSDEHPDRAFLIIEVADTSLDYDRQTKAPLYAASSVEEYWIVNLVQRVVEVYSEAAGGRYAKVELHKPGAVIAPRAFPDVMVVVEELFK